VTLLAGASLAKLGGRDRFLRALASLPWLPIRRARIAVWTVPLAELAAAALLVAAPKAGAAASLALLALFSAVVVRELAAGRRFECGCFGGAGGRRVGPSTLARNAVLAAAAVLVLVLPSSRPIGAALVGVAAGFAALLLEVGSETLALERSS
jgi:hypothetical protein